MRAKLFIVLFFFFQVKLVIGEKVEIPFELDNGLIIIDVVLDGKNDKFLFDTGTNEIIVHTTEGIKNNSTTMMNSLDGDIAIQSQSIDIMQVGELYKRNVAVSVMDLSYVNQFLNNAVGGMIGSFVFAPSSILIDYNTMNIILDEGSHLDLEEFTSSLDYTYYEGVPMTTLNINGTSYYTLLDSGATAHFFDPALINVLDVGKEVHVVTATGQSTQMYGQLSSVKIGGKYYNDLRVIKKDFSTFNENQSIQIVGLLSLKKLAAPTGRLYLDMHTSTMYF